MHSETLHVRVQYLEKKIRQLSERCQDQKTALQQLRQEKEQLIQQVANNKEKLKKLSAKRTLGPIANDEQKMKDWSARIDHCISDIDRSLTHLEQL